MSPHLLLPTPPVIANEVKQSRWQGILGDCFGTQVPRNNEQGWNHDRNYLS